jgi:pimeloyl-ACP methyl ester carboxylesterase
MSTSVILPLLYWDADGRARDDTRFADAMKNGIKGSELLVFESCSHAPIYESVSEFNQKTLSFLSSQTG